MNRLARTALAAALPAAAFSFALAQAPNPPLTITHPVTPGSGPAPTAPMVIHDPYSESAHFVVRHLRLDGQGPAAHVQPGTTVHAVLDINEHCVHCPTPHNHILVGFPGQEMAATCAWSGLRESGGWRTESFTLIAPMRPGVYPIRVRGASTAQPSCDDATLSYWTRDLPGGPGEESTIGVIVVENPRPAGAPTPGGPATTPPPGGSTPGVAPTTYPTVPPAGPVTLNNASFELPDVPAGQISPLAELPGWTRTAGSGIEVHDRSAEAANGSQWVELDGVDSSAIAVEVGTTAGSHYLIGVAFSPRPGTGAIDNRLEIRWNNEVVAVVSASGEGQVRPMWNRMQIRVRATGPTSRLELRDAGASNGQGTFVDDVSIAPTP